MLCRSLARVNIPHSMINWFWFYHKDQTASIHYLLSLIFFRLFCLIFWVFFCCARIWFLSAAVSSRELFFYEFLIEKNQSQPRCRTLRQRKKSAKKNLLHFCEFWFLMQFEMKQKFPNILLPETMKYKSFMSFQREFFFVHDLVKNLWTSNRCFLCMQSRRVSMIFAAYINYVSIASSVICCLLFRCDRRESVIITFVTMVIAWCVSI